MANVVSVKFGKRVRNAVCTTSEGGPDLGTWLTRVRNLNDPMLTAAVEGIWAGRSGDVRIDLEGSNSMLCMGWHNGRVEYSYIS